MNSFDLLFFVVVFPKPTEKSLPVKLDVFPVCSFRYHTNVLKQVARNKVVELYMLVHWCVT